MVTKKKQTHAGYISFRKDRPGDDTFPNVRAFLLCRTIEAVHEWKAEDSAKAEQPEISPTDDPGGSQTPVETVTDQMKRFRKAMLAYHPVVTFIRAVPPILEAGMVQWRLMSYAKEKLELVEEDGKFATFGFDQGHTNRLYQMTSDFSEYRAGMAVMPGSVLLSLVATFDSFFGEFVESMLKLRKERYKNSEKQLKVQDLLKMASFDDVIQSIIDDEIYDLMRGSHAEQVKFVENNFGIKIRSDYD